MVDIVTCPRASTVITLFAILDVHVIYIVVIALNILNTKSSRLRNFLDQIELIASLGQCAKDQQKVVSYIVRNYRPEWSDADVLRMNQP